VSDFDEEVEPPPPETPAQRESRAVRAQLMLLALWVAVFNNDALWGGGVWSFHDLRHHHYPWRAWAARTWASGELPLWAPVAHGYPLMADGQAGILYPPNLLFYRLLSEPVAFDWTVISHHLLATWGAFWLARVSGRTIGASTFAGVAFGFSGFLVSHLVYLGMFQVIAWSPWMVGCAILGARRGGWWWGAAGLVTSMAWLAGHPQAALYASYAAAFAGAWEGGREYLAAEAADRVQVLRRMLGLPVMAVIAMLVALPQLIASAELTGFGLREGGVDAEFAAMGGLPPEELVNAALPFTFGAEAPADVPITYHHRAGIYVGRGISAWEDCFYLGIPVVILALAAGSSRRGRMWWALVAVGVVLMLGASTPLYPLFRLLPGMGYFRFPVRGALWVVLAASQLGALGLDRLGGWLYAAPDRVERRARIVLVGALLFVALAAVAHVGLGVVENPLRSALAVKFTHPDGPEPRTPEDALVRAQGVIDTLGVASAPWEPEVLWPAILALAVGGLAYGAARGRFEKTVLTAAMPTLLALDLWAFGFGYNPKVPAEQVTTRPEGAVALLGEPGLFRTTVLDRRVFSSLDEALMSSNIGLLWGAEDVIIPSPLRTVRNEAYLAAVGLDLGLVDGDTQVAAFEANRRLADLSGVRYLFTTRELTLDGFALVHDEATQAPGSIAVTVRVYRNDHAFERAFAVGCTADAGGDPLGALLAVDDLGGTAIVEGAGLAECVPGAVGTVTTERIRQSELRVTADLDRAAWLVVTETWYPGMLFLVDGVPRVPVRTDDLFMGISLEPGKHTVEVAYRPMPILLSMIVAFFAGTFVSVWVLVGARRDAADGTAPVLG
jgi:hypothetical protein